VSVSFANVNSRRNLTELELFQTWNDTTNNAAVTLNLGSQSKTVNNPTRNANGNIRETLTINQSNASRTGGIDITLSRFNTANGESPREGDGGESLQDIVIDSDIDYSFDSNVTIGTVEVSVAVGISEQSAQIIASETTSPNKKQIDSSTTISGSLFDSGDYNLNTLQLDDGEKTVRITAVAELIIKRNESIVATDKLTDTFEITITKDSVTINGQFSGTGTVSMETEPA